MEKQQLTDTVRNLKRRFFAMRNGMTADQIRRSGSPYRIIFGLNLPQIVEIARDFPRDEDFAEFLWCNTTTRESMLIAPIVCPPEAMDEERAVRWIGTAMSIEAVDILCHRLLRHRPFALDLLPRLLTPDVEDPLTRYAAVRLMFNLQGDADAVARFLPLARAEAASGSPVAPLATMLLANLDEL